MPRIRTRLKGLLATPTLGGRDFISPDFSNANSRWPRNAGASARASTMSSSSMRRSWLASERINTV